jgi:hypothetical protein
LNVEIIEGIGGFAGLADLGVWLPAPGNASLYCGLRWPHL